MDVLASTATSASLLHAADAAFEDLFPHPRDAERQGTGVDGTGSRGRFGGGDGVEAVEEGAAAAATRKSVYHLRQLKQVTICDERLSLELLNNIEYIPVSMALHLRSISFIYIIQSTFCIGNVYILVLLYRFLGDFSYFCC